MPKEKLVSTNELASMIKQGFDGVDERSKSGFDRMDTQFKTVNNRLDHLEADVADLRADMKRGFAGMPSRKEFDDFRQLTDKRDRAFAAKLGLTLAQIDSEG